MTKSHLALGVGGYVVPYPPPPQLGKSVTLCDRLGLPILIKKSDFAIFLCCGAKLDLIPMAPGDDHVLVGQPGWSQGLTSGGHDSLNGGIFSLINITFRM